MNTKSLVSRGFLAFWLALAIIAGAGQAMAQAVNSGPMDQSGKNCYDTKAGENPTSCP